MALTGLVLAALVLLLTRTMTPWWLAADCDSTYVASALNLLGGMPTEKLDHPGLPLQVALAFSFALDQAVRSLHDGLDRLAYIDHALLDMSRTLWMVRAWALVFFLFGLLTSFELARRLFGSVAAGVAGALAFAACPGSLGHALSFRPENVLGGLVLICVYQAGLSLVQRSVTRLLAASVLLGLSMTVKMHALGLLPLFVLAAWRARRWDMQQVAHDVRVWCTPRRWKTVAALATLYLAAVMWMNSGRDWTAMDPRLVGGGVLVAVWLGVGLLARRWCAASRGLRRLLNPVPPAIGLATLAGAVLPNAFFMDQLSPVARVMWWTVSGSQHRGGLEPAALAASVVRQWSQISLAVALPLCAAAAVGTWRAWRQRRMEILAFAPAAGFMFIMAALRGQVHASPHHYGPSLVAAIPLMLMALPWRRGARPGFVASAGARTGLGFPGAAVCAIAALCAWPIITYERAARGQAQRCRAIQELTDLCTPSLRAGEVILCDYWAQNADAAHFMQVRDFSCYTPEMAYRSLPDAPTGLRYAREHGLRPAFLLTCGTQKTKVAPDKQGHLVAHSVWGSAFGVEPVAVRRIAGLELSAWRIVEQADATRLAGSRGRPDD